MTCYDDAHEVARKPTTIAERFACLRQKILGYGATAASEAGRRADDRPHEADLRDKLDAITHEIAEIEQLVRHADESTREDMSASAALGAKRNLRLALGRFRRWTT